MARRHGINLKTVNELEC
nr:hypothetical protein [Shigella sp. FC1967]